MSTAAMLGQQSISPLRIATRAYTEPRMSDQETQIEKELVQLLVISLDEGSEAMKELVDRRCKRLASERDRQVELIGRARRRDARAEADSRQAERSKLEVAKAKGKIRRAEERRQQLAMLPHLNLAAQRKLLRELTKKLISARQARTGQLLAQRSADNHRPVLVFDTETRTGFSQRLMFGGWRLCVWSGDRLVCLQEGIFVADDLSADELDLVRDYARRCKMTAAVDFLHPDASPVLYLITEREFRSLVYKACFKPGAERAAALVGLNINFDISRLALGWGVAKAGRFKGGFSLRLREQYRNADGDLVDSPHHPRYCTKHLSSTKALKGWADEFAGHFIDLRTLMFSLSNRGHSLESGCSKKGFGVIMPGQAEPGYKKRDDVEYGIVNEVALDYLRDDVCATHLLYEQVMREFDKHPIPLQASQSYSAASIGKSQLQAFGISPRLELQPDFPKRVLGVAMSAFFGGRVQCNIRNVVVPVSYLDLLSAYTSVNSLMGLWSWVIAKQIKVTDATNDARRLLAQIDIDQVLDPEIWQQFPMLVQVAPDRDILPTRARYKPEQWNIGISRLTSTEPLWYSMPDVIAAKLLSGKSPRILRAIRLHPQGVQDGLHPAKLRGEVEIDPQENFFARVIETRHERADKNDPTGQFLKTVANSTGYGIFAEMIRIELADGATEQVMVYDGTGEPYLADTHAPERRGDFFFSPLAAAVTAGTRLLLAIIERLVSDLHGTHLLMDTDSCAIVANEHGGKVDYTDHTGVDREIPVLSWAQVDQVRDRMQALNPYEGRAGEKHMLELESENLGPDGKRRELLGLSVSSKRYWLFTRDQDGAPEIQVATELEQHVEVEQDQRSVHIAKRSDHGLGYPVNPMDPNSDGRDYIQAGGEWIIREQLGMDAPEPAVFDRPVLMKTAFTTPRLLANIRRYNHGRPLREQIPPFSFAMTARQKPGQRFPAIVGKCALIAPFESDPDKWNKLRFVNHADPDSIDYLITTKDRCEDEAETVNPVSVRNFREVFDEYRRSPEVKMLGPNGMPCGPDTIGQLERRDVIADGPPKVIGKEMAEVDAHHAGLHTAESQYLNEHLRPGEDEWTLLILPALRLLRKLRSLSIEEIAAGAGVNRETVSHALSGDPVRVIEVREKLTRYASRGARSMISDRGEMPPTAHEGRLRRFLHLFGETERVCASDACEKPARPRSPYCSDRCRKQATYREGQAEAA